MQCVVLTLNCLLPCNAAQGCGLKLESQLWFSAERGHAKLDFSRLCFTP